MTDDRHAFVCILQICVPSQLSAATTTPRERPTLSARLGRNPTRVGWWSTVPAWERGVDASHVPPEVREHFHLGVNSRSCLFKFPPNPVASITQLADQKVSRALLALVPCSSLNRNVTWWGVNTSLINEETLVYSGQKTKNKKIPGTSPLMLNYPMEVFVLNGTNIKPRCSRRIQQIITAHFLSHVRHVWSFQRSLSINYPT